MALFVICHQDLPVFALPEDAHIMWMSATPPPDVGGRQFVHGYDFFENAQVLHRKLSGALGSIAIARYLGTLEKRPTSVTVWQYRKFVTRQAFGHPSPNYSGMRLVAPAEAAEADPASELAGNHFMAVRPLALGAMIDQYHHHHNLMDLLRYVAIAIESAALTQAEAMDFLKGTHLVPGGLELGTYETDAWIEDIEAIAQVSLAFVERFEPHQPDDPYQSRAVAFCQERLGSYLYLKRLRQASPRAVPSELFGIMHTVTSEAVYRGGSA